MASIAHSVYAISTGEGAIPAIGASGAISGVLGAYLIFFPHAKIHTITFALIIDFYISQVLSELFHLLPICLRQSSSYSAAEE